MKGELDSKLPELVEELSKLVDEFKGLCQDYLEGKSKKVGKVSFKKIVEVVKVVKRLQQKVYNKIIIVYNLKTLNTFTLLNIKLIFVLNN